MPQVAIDQRDRDGSIRWAEKRNTVPTPNFCTLQLRRKYDEIFWRAWH